MAHHYSGHRTGPSESAPTIVFTHDAATILDPAISNALRGTGAFRGLSARDRRLLGSRCDMVCVESGKVLFTQGDCDRWVFVLLEGELILKACDGREHRVVGGTAGAERIVSRPKPRLHTATASGPARLIRIDGSSIGYWHSSIDASTMLLEGLSDTAQLDEFDGACAKAAAELELPEMPDIAMKARELIDRDECDVESIARLLCDDESMVAKLIRVANSPIYYGAQDVQTCDQAIVRLGMKTTRYMIIAFAVRQLFDLGDSVVSHLVRELWDHSTEVAAIASVLARRSRIFDPGEAQLAGLLHDVGVIPVLNAAARRSVLGQNTSAVMALMSRRRVAIGRDVLQKWCFPPLLVASAVEAESWHRDTGREADMADIVVVAQLLSFIGKGHLVDVAPVLSLPAIRKVLGEDTSLKQVLHFLEEFAAPIEEVRSLLRG